MIASFLIFCCSLAPRDVLQQAGVSQVRCSLQDEVDCGGRQPFLALQVWAFDHVVDQAVNMGSRRHNTVPVMWLNATQFVYFKTTCFDRCLTNSYKCRSDNFNLDPNFKFEQIQHSNKNVTRSKSVQMSRNLSKSRAKNRRKTDVKIFPGPRRSFCNLFTKTKTTNKFAKHDKFDFVVGPCKCAKTQLFIAALAYLVWHCTKACVLSI